MRSSFLKIILFVACASLILGCANPTREVATKLTAQYPVREAQMTNRPAADDLPSGVWKIQGAHNTMYLAGTCHVVADDQVPFPAPFYAAYQGAREIYVECDTDLSLFAKVRLLVKMWPWLKAHRDELVCPKGRTLAYYLTPETLKELRDLYGTDLSKERLTPQALLIQSESSLPNQFDGDFAGVEDIFTLLAHQDGKPLRELDDKNIINTVFAVMDEMLSKWNKDIAEKGADAVIKENLIDDADEEDNLDWRRGDLAAVEQMQDEMKEESPDLYDKLLVERNRKWLPKLESALHGEHDVMVMVGIMHLAGKDGLIHQLQERGYHTEQMFGLDRPPRAILKTKVKPGGTGKMAGRVRMGEPVIAN